MIFITNKYSSFLMAFRIIKINQSKGKYEWEGESGMEEQHIYHAAEDPRWAHPVFDAEEIRKRILPDGTEILYQFYHAKFEGTNVKVSLCYPMNRKDFTNRFFMYVSPFPGPDEEMASMGMERVGEDDRIAFSILHGAGHVETNMGSTKMFGGHETEEESRDIYRSCAAAAELCRSKAKEIFETKEHIFGYLHGGSGGAYKTISCIENTDSFDGAVAYVVGTPESTPNCIVAKPNAARKLRNVLPKIADAVDAGGGDMYEGLKEEERKALKEITAFGFPPRTWHLYKQIDDGALPVLIGGVLKKKSRVLSGFLDG